MFFCKIAHVLNLNLTLIEIIIIIGYFTEASMKVAICDDDKTSVRIISDYIKDFFNRNNIETDLYEYFCGEDLMSSEIIFDIAFLDIEMKGASGLETADFINKHSKRTLIFIITSHQQYLDDAMDLDVFRYIDKPVNQKRLYKSLEKALDMLSNEIIALETAAGELIRLNKQEIIYAEITGRKVTVHTDKETYCTKEKIKALRGKLNTSDFIYPHNSYIVNLKYVIKYKRDELILQNNAVIPIASRKQSEIRKEFINYMGDEYDIF